MALSNFKADASFLKRLELSARYPVKIVATPMSKNTESLNADAHTDRSSELRCCTSVTFNTKKLQESIKSQKAYTSIKREAVEELPCLREWPCDKKSLPFHGKSSRYSTKAQDQGGFSREGKTSPSNSFVLNDFSP